MNVFRRYRPAAIFLLFAFTGNAPAEIKVGSTRDEVLAEWGKPTGNLRDANGEELVYRQASVTVQDGRVTKLTVLPSTSAPITPAPAKLVARVVETAPQGADIAVINNKGQPVALEDLIVRGKITIIDFYADWCGPCRQMAPALEHLAQQDAGIALRKVNIVNWNTPVARQYGLTSIPNVRVYDRHGNQIGEPTHSLQVVGQNILTATKR